MQYYLLIVSDLDSSKRWLPSAYELALYRLSRKQWGLNQRTRNRKYVKKGDRLLVYAGGEREHAKCFVGCAVAGTKAMLTPYSERTQVNVPEGNVAAPSDYFIRLNQIRLFQTPISIRSIIHRLSFVTSPNSPRWACRLFGGTLKISAKDYNLIFRAAKKVKATPC